MSEPIRIYVGSQEAQMLAVQVLEYSIRRSASLPVEVFPLHHARVEYPMPRDPQNRPRTPFSFQRFFIPSLAGYRGRAIYLDSDMQVFKDIRSLWDLPFDGADLLAAREPGATGRKPQFSVMLLDCDELRWNLGDIVAALDRGELTYETLMYEMALARRVHASIDPSWNSLETYHEGETALLHYTDMPTQPWVSCDNKNGHLWVRDLLDAIDSGFITRAHVEEHVRTGSVRPSLLLQVDRRVVHAADLLREARAADAAFVPPYRRMDPHGRSAADKLRAAIRRVYERSPLSRVGRRALGE